MFPSPGPDIRDHLFAWRSCPPPARRHPPGAEKTGALPEDPAGLGRLFHCPVFLPPPAHQKTRASCEWLRTPLHCTQGCGVGRFFRLLTPDSDSSSFEKPTPTPAVLKTDSDSSSFKNRLRLQQF